MLRILLADDHALYREGVKLLLERADFSVIAEATDGSEAVRLALELLPDIAVLDLSMPELNGIAAARKIRTALPDTPIVLLTMHEEEVVILEALKAGINGYVFKTQTGQDLVHTLHMVADGSLYLSPNIPQSVIGALTHNSPQPDEALSPRELRILELIADGRTSREIAGILELSPKTIEAHRGRMMHKLKFREAIQLVCYAVRSQMTKGVPLGAPE